MPPCCPLSVRVAWTILSSHARKPACSAPCAALCTTRACNIMDCGVQNTCALQQNLL